jgi:hypothetical protein
MLFIFMVKSIFADNIEINWGTTAVTKNKNILWGDISVAKLRHIPSAELPLKENVNGFIKKIIKKSETQLNLYANSHLYTITGLTFSKIEEYNAWIFTIGYSQKKFISKWKYASQSFTGNFFLHYYANAEPVEIKKAKASADSLIHKKKIDNFLNTTKWMPNDITHKSAGYSFIIARYDISKTLPWTPNAKGLPISISDVVKIAEKELTKYITKNDIERINKVNFVLSKIAICRFYETNFWYCIISFSDKLNNINIDVPILFSGKVIPGV